MLYIRREIIRRSVPSKRWVTSVEKACVGRSSITLATTSKLWRKYRCHSVCCCGGNTEGSALLGGQSLVIVPDNLSSTSSPLPDIKMWRNSKRQNQVTWYFKKTKVKKKKKKKLIQWINFLGKLFPQKANDPHSMTYFSPHCHRSNRF